MLRHFGQPGGIGVYTVNVLRALFNVDRRNQYVLIYRDRRHLGQFSGFSNVKEEVLHAPNRLLWDQFTVPKFAIREGLNIIYNPKLSVPLFAPCKTILVMHGAEQFAVPQAFKWYDRMYFSVANRLYCRRASAIIAMTHTGAKDITKYMGARPDKIRVIYEAYNERCRVMPKEKVEEVKARYNLPDHFILFVGGLSPLKNLANLIRAFKRLETTFHYKLVVVGFKRWKFAQDIQLVDELELADRVLFTGFVPDEDIPAFYNAAELFVFPSLYEGFGIPALEAMACGCPVITSKAGCSPEIAGGAAVLVDPYSPEDIAKAIRRVLTEQPLKRDLIEKGLKRSAEFSWEKCAMETVAVFESVSNGNV